VKRREPTGKEDGKYMVILITICLYRTCVHVTFGSGQGIPNVSNVCVLSGVSAWSVLLYDLRALFWAKTLVFLAYGGGMLRVVASTRTITLCPTLSGCILLVSA